MIMIIIILIIIITIIVIIKAKTFEVDDKQQMDPAQVSSNKVRYVIYWLILAKERLKENEEKKWKLISDSSSW